MNRPIESEPVGRPAGERLSLKSRIIIAVGRRIGAFPSVGRDGQMSDRSVEIMDESIRRRMDEEMVAALGPQHDGDTIFEPRSEEHTSELQSQSNLVCRL